MSSMPTHIADKDIATMSSLANLWLSDARQTYTSMVDNFFAHNELCSSEPFTCLFTPTIDDPDVRIKIEICQHTSHSECLFESTLESKNSDEIEKIIIEFVDYLTQYAEGSDHVQLAMVLPDPIADKERNFTSELLRTLHWQRILLRSAELFKKINIHNTHKFGGMIVLLPEGKVIELSRAIDLVNNHTTLLLSRYYDTFKKRNLSGFLKSSERSPSEKALALRFFVHSNEFLDYLEDKERNQVISLLMDNNLQALLKNKYRLFQKVLTNHNLTAIFPNYASGDAAKIDPFSFGDIMLVADKHVLQWAATIETTEELVDNTLEQISGFNLNDETIRVLAQFYQNSDNTLKSMINQKVISHFSNESHVPVWQSLTEQPFPAIALDCALADSSGIRSFGRGILFTQSLDDCVPYITNKDHVEVLCFLKQSTPFEIMSHENLSEAGRIATMESIT